MEAIKDMLRYQKKLTKEDLYFRKQDRLMQNAVIPKFERNKMTRKMHFQTHHANMLALPKKQEEKYATTQDRINEQGFKPQKKKPLPLDEIRNSLF